MRQGRIGPVLLLLVLGVGLGAVSPAELFDQASVAYGKQDFVLASTLFARFTKEFADDPKAVTATFLRGVCQLQSGQPQAALDTFQKLDRAVPLSAFRKRLPYWKGSAALAAGLLAVAERELVAQAQFPDERPWTVRALYQLAQVRWQQKQPLVAVELLRAFLTQSQDADWKARAELQWGQELRRTGSPDALTHLANASLLDPGSATDLEARKTRLELLLISRQGTEARALAEDSLAAFPSERDVWDLGRIEALRLIGSTDALAVALRERLARENDDLKRQKLAVNLAVLADEAGQPDINLWTTASSGPSSDLASTASRRVAALLEQRGDWAAAARIWLAHPEREDWLHRGVEDLRTAGDLGSALSGLSDLLKRYPNSPRVPAWLDVRAGILLSQDDTTGALRDLERVLKSYPNYERSGEARYQIGLVYLKRNEPMRAEAYFFGLISELKSGDLYERSLLARGQCYVNAGKPDLARGSLERLIREVPTGRWSSDAWYALAKTSLQELKPEVAWEAFSRSAALSNDPVRQAQATWEGLNALTGQTAPSRLSELYTQFARRFPSDNRAEDALYRSGLVWAQDQQPVRALEVWSGVLPTVRAVARDQLRQGMSLALLAQGQIPEALQQLNLLETETTRPESAASAWFQWGQSATSLGLSSEATSAFETLIRLHPDSPLVEKALPRAAGALLGVGNPTLALSRYADYFGRFGQQTRSVAVARAAAAASAPYPELLESLYRSSRAWDLSSEVRAEFDLAWWKAQLDVDAAQALGQLQKLSREAPWNSQRSQALTIAGLWSLAQGRTEDARAYLEAAQSIGDDLSVFRARLGLADVAEKEGRALDAARQKEGAEKSAGPGVPLEFRQSALKAALTLWKAAARSEDVQRVEARLNRLGP